jgi:hypothetical protein
VDRYPEELVSFYWAKEKLGICWIEKEELVNYQ